MLPKICLAAGGSGSAVVFFSGPMINAKACPPCSRRLHSWLIRSADIVVVPSLKDNWGIVVDEGLQLGKIVISSDATGSGYDRIVHGSNDHIFPASNSNALADILSSLLRGRLTENAVGKVARNSPRNIKPANNLSSPLRIVQGS